MAINNLVKHSVLRLPSASNEPNDLTISPIDSGGSEQNTDGDSDCMAMISLIFSSRGIASDDSAIASNKVLNVFMDS